MKRKSVTTASSFQKILNFVLTIKYLVFEEFDLENRSQKTKLAENGERIQKYER